MTRPKPARLDRLLVERGLAPSRGRARELIEAGRVKVGGVVITKAASQVRPDRPIELVSTERVWVGRGAQKLLGALEALPMEVEGRICADLGASTGGFTEVLLEHGAERVYAVDVGRGQLHSRLAADPRVVVRDGVNARYLESLDEPVERVVGDLSFISLSLILPAIARIAPGGEALLLIKPQFEAGRSGIARGGVVRDVAVREAAIERVCGEARDAGFTVVGRADCVIRGAKSGNLEHFVWLRCPGVSIPR